MALVKLNTAQGPDPSGYQVLRNMHIFAADGEEHRGPQFLPWHRIYLLDLERQFQAINPAVSLHYWRFDQPAHKIFSRALRRRHEAIDDDGLAGGIRSVESAGRVGHQLGAGNRAFVPFQYADRGGARKSGIPAAQSGPNLGCRDEVSPVRAYGRLSSRGGARLIQRVDLGHRDRSRRIRCSSCCTPTSTVCGRSGSGSTAGWSSPGSTELHGSESGWPAGR